MADAIMQPLVQSSLVNQSGHLICRTFSLKLGPALAHTVFTLPDFECRYNSLPGPDRLFSEDHPQVKIFTGAFRLLDQRS